MRYADIREAFCEGQLSKCDFFKVWKHYETHGRHEQRTLQCLPGSAGISLEALALQKAVQTKNSLVYIPTGDIHFGNSSLLIDRADKLIIQGAGPQHSRLWFEPGHGVQLVSSRDVQIGGFSIDCKHAPYAQGRIIGMHEKNRTHQPYVTIQLEEGFPSLMHSRLFERTKRFKVIYWDPVTRHMRRTQSLYDPDVRFKTLGGRTYRMLYDSPMGYVPASGDLITISPRQLSTDVLVRSTEHLMSSYHKGAFLALNSTRVTVEDMDVHCSAMMALLELGGEGGHVYRRVGICRRPPAHLTRPEKMVLPHWPPRRHPRQEILLRQTQDMLAEPMPADGNAPDPREMTVAELRRMQRLSWWQMEYPQRLLASNGDGLHSFSVRHGPQLVESYFEFIGEDAVSVHNRVWPITSVRNGGKLLVALDLSAMSGTGLVHARYEPDVILKGHRLRVYALNTREFLGAAVITRIDHVRHNVPSRSHVNTALRNLGVQDLISHTSAAPRVVALHISSRLNMSELAPYSAFVQFEAAGGAMLVNNTFTDTYNTLARFAVSNSLIERNQFKRAHEGIHIRFVPEFLEGQVGVRNVTIRGNTFQSIRGCGADACDFVCKDFDCILSNVDKEVLPELRSHGNKVISRGYPHHVKNRTRGIGGSRDL